jgi:hypothetical protein
MLHKALKETGEGSGWGTLKARSIGLESLRKTSLAGETN